MAEQIPQTVQFQEALEIYRSGRAPRKEAAAVVAEMRASTFVHRSLGWRSVEEYGKSRRLLTGEEIIGSTPMAVGLRHSIFDYPTDSTTLHTLYLTSYPALLI